MMHARPRLRRLLPAPEHRLGAGVLAAVVVTLVLAALAARPLTALLTADAASPVSAVPAAAPATFNDELQLALSRFRGRSIFFTPAPPPPPVVREPDRGPSGPPARYGGPALVAMIGDTAWFADGRKLVAGADAGSGDLRVLETSPPWFARVAWSGGEYTVTLFDRSGAASAVTIPAPPPAPASGRPAPPPAPPAGETPRQPPQPEPAEPEPNEPVPGPPPEPDPAQPPPDPQPEAPPSEPPAPSSPPPSPAPEPQTPATPQ